MSDYACPDDGLLHRLTITADIPSEPGIEMVAAELLLDLVHRFECQGTIPEGIRLEITTRLRT